MHGPDTVAPPSGHHWKDSGCKWFHRRTIAPFCSGLMLSLWRWPFLFLSYAPLFCHFLSTSSPIQRQKNPLKKWYILYCSSFTPAYIWCSNYKLSSFILRCYQIGLLTRCVRIAPCALITSLGFHSKPTTRAASWPLHLLGGMREVLDCCSCEIKYRKWSGSTAQCHRRTGNLKRTPIHPRTVVFKQRVKGELISV